MTVPELVATCGTNSETSAAADEAETLRRDLTADQAEGRRQLGSYLPLRMIIFSLSANPAMRSQNI